MAENIGPKIGIEGEATFRSQLAQINAGLKTLGSEMKAVTSEFIGNEKSIEALTAENDVLQRSVLTLNDRLELQKKMLQETASAYGEADTRTMKWQQAVNNTQTEINRYNAQIEENTELLKNEGKTAEEVAKEQEKAAEREEKAHEKRVAALKKVTAGFAAMAAAAMAAAAAVGKMVLDAAQKADDINTLAVQTGLSTDEIQKFQYAAERIDVPLETMTGSMAKLTKNMASAQNGSKNTAAAFDALGISITDENGQLRNNQDVFYEVIDALGKMDNETQADAYAMQIFGKSAQSLNPLIRGGAEELKNLGDEAEAAGLILSQDSLDGLNRVQDAVDTFKASISGAGSLFSTAFAGPIAEGIETLTGFIQRLTSAFSNGGLDALAEEVGSVMTDLLGHLRDALPKVVKFGTDLLLKLIDGIIAMLPSLTATGIEIIVTLVNAIADSLPKLIPAAVDAILTIVDSLLDNVDSLIDAALHLIEALAEGLINALPKLAEKVPQIMVKIVETLTRNFPKIVETGVKLIVQLTSGLIKAIPQLVKALPEIWQAIKNGLSDMAKRMIDLGLDLVKGLWQGIKDAAAWLKDKIKGWCADILGGIKDFFGISSPSKVMADMVGKNMAEGVGVGFVNTMDDIADQMQAAIPTPTVSMPDLLAGAVNALLTAAMGGGTYRVEIPLYIDGMEFYRATITDLRQVLRADPIPA